MSEEMGVLKQLIAAVEPELAQPQVEDDDDSGLVGPIELGRATEEMEEIELRRSQRRTLARMLGLLPATSRIRLLAEGCPNVLEVMSEQPAQDFVAVSIRKMRAITLDDSSAFALRCFDTIVACLDPVRAAAVSRAANAVPAAVWRVPVDGRQRRAAGLLRHRPSR